MTRTKNDVPEELWIYARGSPELINNVLNNPFPREEWKHRGKKLQQEFFKRAEAHGTSPDFERQIAARRELLISLSEGLQVEVSGDPDKDNRELEQTVRKAISHRVVKDLIGEYWRTKEKKHDEQSLTARPNTLLPSELLDDMDPETLLLVEQTHTEERFVKELLNQVKFSKLEEKFLSQLCRGVTIAEASRRVDCKPSTGRTLFQRIRTKMLKARENAAALSLSTFGIHPR